MAKKYLETIFTPAIRHAQEHYYQHRRPELPPGAENDPLRPEEIDFIATRDSFYLATVTETGWPYLQHRGGPAGFLRVVHPRQLAFLDGPGNTQMISTGNLAVNDRVSIFLMDYPQRERLKILGHARVLDAREHPDQVEALKTPGQDFPAERIFLIDVISYDWNCPKYITPRFTAEEIEEVIAPLQARIAELEQRLAK